MSTTDKYLETVRQLKAERDAARADAERLAAAIRDWWDEPGDGNADAIRSALAEHDALAAREAGQ